MGTLFTPIVVALVANLVRAKVCIAFMANAVNSLSDFLVHQRLAGASPIDSEARLTLPPSYNWFDFTLLTNLFLALPFYLFPFHTIIRKIVSKVSHFC